MIRREGAIFFAAWGYFTRLPVPRWGGYEHAHFKQVMRWFPAMGFIVGACGAAVTLAALLWWSVPVAVICGMATTLLVTGALHEDGLADTLDGCGGGTTREDKLRIMKDSRLGSFGAIGISLALLLKFSLLTELAVMPPASFALVLIAAHSVSRLAAMAQMIGLDYAREEGKSMALTARMGKGSWAFAVLCGLFPCFFLPHAQLATALLLLIFFTLAATRYAFKHLGGYTGDTLGATQQFSELAFYLGMTCDFF
jgi:adenosylcobinamide-GDP ribazoletransferase